jgi:hypothetical protein
MELTLGPKQGKEIPFEVHAPYKVSGGWFSAVVFALIPKVTPFGENEAGTSVAINFRIPVQLEVTIKSSLTPRPKKVEVTGIEIIPASEDKDYSLMLKNTAKDALIIKATVNNRGDMYIKGKGRLVITDRKGKRLRDVPLGAGRGMVLPQTQVKFTSIIKRPLPGDYVAEAIINYGGLTQAIGRMPFTVSRRIQAKENSFLSSSPIGLVTSKGVIDMFIPPNSYRTQILTLTNEENQTVKVKTLPKYLRFDENGDIIASDSGNNQFSCIKWLTIEPNNFEIPAGETKTLKILVKSPDVSPGGRYACIDMEAFLIGAKDTTLPSPLQVPIILTVPGLAEKKGEIMKTDISTGNPPRFSVYFKNLGNVHVKPKVKIEMKFLPKVSSSGDLTYVGEPRSELVSTFSMKDFSVAVLPGCIAKIEQDYDKVLNPGNYMAVVTVDFGGSEPAIFTQKFTVK